MSPKLTEPKGERKFDGRIDPIFSKKYIENGIN